MERFKFQPQKEVLKEKKLSVTIALEGKLASDFQDFTLKCKEHCKVNNAEVVRQMIEFAMQHLDTQLPIAVGDVMEERSFESELFQVSTQP